MAGKALSPAETEARRVLAQSVDRLTTRLGIIADARVLWRCTWEQLESTAEDQSADCWEDSQCWLSLPNLRRLAELNGESLRAEFGLAFEEFGASTRDALLRCDWYLRGEQPPDVQALMRRLGSMSAFVLLALQRSDLDSVVNQLYTHIEQVGIAAATVWKSETKWTKASLCNRLNLSPSSFDKLRIAAGVEAGAVGDTTRAFTFDDLADMADVALSALPKRGEHDQRELRRIITESLV